MKEEMPSHEPLYAFHKIPGVISLSTNCLWERITRPLKPQLEYIWIIINFLKALSAGLWQWFPWPAADTGFSEIVRA